MSWYYRELEMSAADKQVYVFELSFISDLTLVYSGLTLQTKGSPDNYHEVTHVVYITCEAGDTFP